MKNNIRIGSDWCRRSGKFTLRQLQSGKFTLRQLQSGRSGKSTLRQLLRQLMQHPTIDTEKKKDAAQASPTKRGEGKQHKAKPTSRTTTTRE